MLCHVNIKRHLSRRRQLGSIRGTELSSGAQLLIARASITKASSQANHEIPGCPAEDNITS